MSNFLINKALVAHLQAMPDYINELARENVSYTPKNGVAYQAVYLTPRDPENPTYGDNYHRLVGTFHIVLHFPRNQGTGAAQVYAEKIVKHFSRSTYIATDDCVVQIRRTPAIGGGYIDTDRYCIPIRIEYFSNAS